MAEVNVIIYNLGGEQEIGRVSLKHAIRMLHRKVAQVREAVEGETFGGYQRPMSIELVRYIHTKWVYEHTGRVPYTKAALLRRDKHKCGYCGRRATTMDHIKPRCQGGKGEWLNAVAACEACNFAKAGRTPKQADMKLRMKPFIPTFEDIYPSSKAKRK
jgi:5-methylcytosine-specific restriction endonuclease McrA